MQKIIIHLKNNETIDRYVNFLRNGYSEDEVYSKEVRNTIEEFINNGWKVYLTSIENLDESRNEYMRVYDIENDKDLTMTIDEVNTEIKAMIIRVIGSIEGNFFNIKKYLEYLQNNYKGLVINDPKAMIKGMTKNYLTEIDEETLLNIGIKMIPTKIYDNHVSMDTLKHDYDNLSDYLIKPLSGELSNSLKNLGEIDEEFLRYKENKVLGWVVQPIMQEVWNGEYQMAFLGGKLVYAQCKEYTNKDSSIPTQKSRILHKYSPSNDEITMAKKLIEYFKEKYNLTIHICRVDFMKDKNGMPILLEFEMVNPGFFIGYMDENDNDIKKITSEIRKYCEQ